ncbi:MAG: hypothetical protein HZB38_15245, partial [Planctomycetes bacterium]|nr:hypothetical protein [Planctomycetota bacterium]
MMQERTARAWKVALATLVCWGGSCALAQEEAGNDGIARPARPASVIPPGLDDSLAPIQPLQPAPDLPDVRDCATDPTPTGESLMLWEQLSALGPDLRANAVIELELGTAATPAQRESAAEISRLWNQGDYDGAIAVLQVLENSGAAPAVGIAWREPLPPARTRMADVRIGGTRADAGTMNIDFDAQNGRLFMVVRWGTTTGTSAWTMNTSTDGGVTWAETYVFGSSVGLLDADC